MAPRRNRRRAVSRARHTPARRASADDPAIDALYGLEPPIDPVGPERPGAGLQTAALDCPYCGEHIETLVDLSTGSAAYIEDCQVCCQPIELSVEVDGGGELVAIRTARSD